MLYCVYLKLLVVIQSPLPALPSVVQQQGIRTTDYICSCASLPLESTYIIDYMNLIAVYIQTSFTSTDIV